MEGDIVISQSSPEPGVPSSGSFIFWANNVLCRKEPFKVKVKVR